VSSSLRASASCASDLDGRHQGDYDAGQGESVRQHGREEARGGEREPGDRQRRPYDPSIAPTCDRIDDQEREAADHREDDDAGVAEVGEGVGEEARVGIRALMEVHRSDQERGIDAV